MASSLLIGNVAALVAAHHGILAAGRDTWGVGQPHWSAAL
jgi:hypothetical protein